MPTETPISTEPTTTVNKTAQPSSDEAATTELRSRLLRMILTNEEDRRPSLSSHPLQR